MFYFFNAKEVIPGGVQAYSRVAYTVRDCNIFNILLQLIYYSHSSSENIKVQIKLYPATPFGSQSFYTTFDDSRYKDYPLV